MENILWLKQDLQQLRQLPLGQVEIFQNHLQRTLVAKIIVISPNFTYAEFFLAIETTSNSVQTPLLDVQPLKTCGVAAQTAFDRELKTVLAGSYPSSTQSLYVYLCAISIVVCNHFGGWGCSRDCIGIDEAYWNFMVF